MAKIQIRRGSDLFRQSIILSSGEFYYCTENHHLFIGDGLTPGGRRLQDQMGFGSLAWENASSLSQSFLPSEANTLSLGSLEKPWKSAFIHALKLENNQISTLEGNDNIVLSPHGTGVIALTKSAQTFNLDPVINNVLFVKAHFIAQTSIAPDPSVVPSIGFHIPNVVGKALYMTHTGEFRTIDNTYTDERFLTATNLKTTGNTLFSTNLNGNIYLTPNGEGDIILPNADCRSTNGIGPNAWIKGIFGDSSNSCLVLGTLDESPNGISGSAKRAVIGSHNNALNAWDDLLLNVQPNDISGGSIYSRNHYPTNHHLYSLGGNLKAWASGFIGNFCLSGNTLSSTTGNIILAPYGNGVTVSERRFQYNGNVNAESHGLEIRNDYPIADGTKSGIGFGGYRDVDPYHLVAKIVAEHKPSSAGNLKHACDLVFYSSNANGDLAEYFRLVKEGFIDSVGIKPQSSSLYSLGNGSYLWNNIYLTNAPIIASDQRYKENIEPSDLGLEFILAQKPVKWIPKIPLEKTEKRSILKQKTKPSKKNRQFIEKINDRYILKETEVLIEEPLFQTVDLFDEKGNLLKKLEIPLLEEVEEESHSLLKENPDQRPHYGLIAQEVKKSMEALNIPDFAGYIEDESCGRLALRYTEFIGPIIKAIQELHEKVETLLKERKSHA